jgi:hypothetical protein
MLTIFSTPKRFVGHIEITQRNFELAGGFAHLHTLEDAAFRMTGDSIEPRRLYWLAPARRAARRVVKKARDTSRVRFLHPLLDATRSARHAIGLREQNLQIRPKKAIRRHEFDR